MGLGCRQVQGGLIRVAPHSREPRTHTPEHLIECHANKRRQFHAPLTELAFSQSRWDETPFEVGII